MKQAGKTNKDESLLKANGHLHKCKEKRVIPKTTFLLFEVTKRDGISLKIQF